MRSPWLWIAGSLVALLCAGCPNGNGGKTDGASDGQTDGKTDGAADGAADGETDGASSGDPLEGSIFDKEALFEIYAGDMQGGDAKLAARKKHRLVDKAGKPLPTRVAAYERSLQRYAKGDPEGWSAFLDKLAR